MFKSIVHEGVLITWHDFMVAQAGASAALAGLIFVAVSINLDKILKYPHLPVRALEALVVLLSVLLIATFGLVPDQPIELYGLEFAATGLLIWLVQTAALRKTRGSGYESGLRAFMNQAPPLPFILSGLILLFGSTSGLYWIVPGVIMSTFSGVYSAWILLVEIQR